MSDWWTHLSALNKAFYGGAAFFSVFFVWQLVAALIGLGDDGADIDADGDMDAGMDVDGDMDGDVDAIETIDAFKLLSLRSVIAFLTLFTWGGAMYLQGGMNPGKALSISAVWGLVGMCGVAVLIHFMRKMAHNGTRLLDTSVGAQGMVYLDIPQDGTGEVKVPVSAIMSHVKARGKGGTAIKAGTPVAVTRMLDQTTVEVEPV